MRVLAVISARGGSKSIPKKNIAEVGGKPLIAWTILSAKQCPSLDRIIVSTDDDAIAQVARTWGADVPFTRPKELARDNTPGIAPVIHAVQWLEDNENYRPDYVVLLQPTSPLRTAEDIENVIRLAREKNAEAVVSVCPLVHHPFWTKNVSPQGYLEDFLTTHSSIDRRQDLPPVYGLNGAVYLARRRVLLEKQTWYVSRTCAYVMPAQRSLDIDEPWDLYLTDLILKDRYRHERD